MMNLSKIPPYMRGGLELYVYEGILPGGFLTAVLENKLVEAFMHADEVNAAALRDWASFMYWEMPTQSWRNWEKVEAWCKERQADPIERGTL